MNNIKEKNQELFEKLLSFLTENEDDFDVIKIDGARCEFYDIEEEALININNVNQVKVSDFVTDLLEEFEYSDYSIKLTNPRDYINLDALNNAFCELDEKLLFCLKNILIPFNESDIAICENYLCRDLLFDGEDYTLGQISHDLNTVTVNMYQIFESVRKLKCYSENEFLLTIAKAFLETLIHELAHMSFDARIFGDAYSVFNSDLDINEEIEEELVEEYAKKAFFKIDDSMDISNIFVNKSLILKEFK
jgi:hypothetical protein